MGSMKINFIININVNNVYVIFLLYPAGSRSGSSSSFGSGSDSLICSFEFTRLPVPVGPQPRRNKGELKASKAEGGRSISRCVPLRLASGSGGGPPLRQPDPRFV